MTRSARAFQLKARAGQVVEVRGSEVHKHTDRYGTHLEKQYNWLRRFEGNPAVVNVRGFERRGLGALLRMDYVEGRPLHRELIEESTGRNRKVQSVLEVLRGFHMEEPPGTPLLERHDLEAHYVGKALERWKEACLLMPCLGSSLLRVNGRWHPNPYFTIAKQAEAILDFLASEATIGLIHGDPNLSNVLWDARRQAPVLVDPRGAFGTHRYTGDVNYDLAKVLYSLNGFCDLIEGRGSVSLPDEHSIELRVEVSPPLAAAQAQVESFIARHYAVSDQCLALIQALIYLSAPPLHSHSVFEMYALFERGLWCFGKTQFVRLTCESMSSDAMA